MERLEINRNSKEMKEFIVIGKTDLYDDKEHIHTIIKGNKYISLNYNNRYCKNETN